MSDGRIWDWVGVYMGHKTLIRVDWMISRLMYA